MDTASKFPLEFWDYLAFGAYILILSLIGLWVGRKEKVDSADYFLAGRTLPWYVVGGSFIASNISSEHFIGLVGAAFVYGICMAMYEWNNINTFTLLIWFFIPFLLVARVFTIPEFLERRFNHALRQTFAIITIVCNVVAFLAAVLYGGGLALNKLFGWNLWFAIVLLGVVAGSWAVYGGLKSVAWTDLFTVIVMIVGGVMVTVFGLYMLSGDSHSLVEGFRVMLERNKAQAGVWAEVVAQNVGNMVDADHYNRLAVIQPISHHAAPWPQLFLGVFSIGIWYNVINQFMIQRVLGAKDIYHARMGIVFAGFMKVIMPLITVIPGLILFARFPEVMKLPWDQIRPEADKGYVTLVQMLVPVGLRGLFLAALFGAIQSTVNSVLNSTATIFTLDIYKRVFRSDASEKRLVSIGVWSSVVILFVSIVLAGFIGKLQGSLFIYIQTLYAFFAPPFSAIFVLGILWRRINAHGATTAVLLGFLMAIAIKVYVTLPGHPAWLEPFSMQGIINFGFCVIVCATVSLFTPRPSPEHVTDQLTFNWKKLNIFDGLGSRWYNSVVLWWLLLACTIVSLVITFSGFFIK